MERKQHDERAPYNVQNWPEYRGGEFAAGLAEQSYDADAERQAALEAATTGDLGALQLNMAIIRSADRRKLLNQLMAEAATRGYAEIVQMCKDRGADGYDRAMAYAAAENHTRIMEMCKDWGAANYDWAMRNAAYGGHKAVVVRCQEWRSRQYDEPPHNQDTHAAVMCAAAWRGHEEIVKQCGEWGMVTAEGRYAAMVFANQAGHGRIARLLTEPP